jgi:hypothetical protein
LDCGGTSGTTGRGVPVGGADGSVRSASPGVADAGGADAGPVPALFVAVTMNV